MNKESASIEPKLILQEMMNAHYDPRPKAEAYFKKQWNQHWPYQKDEARAALNKDHMQENEDVREGRHMPPHAPEYIGTPMLRHMKKGFAKEAMKSGFSEEQTNELMKTALNVGKLWNAAKGLGSKYVSEPVTSIPGDWKAWGAAKEQAGQHMDHYNQTIKAQDLTNPEAFKNPANQRLLDLLEQQREATQQTLSTARNKSLYGLGVAGTGLGGAGLAAASMIPSGGQQMPQDIQGGAENGAYPNNFQNT